MVYLQSVPLWLSTSLRINQCIYNISIYVNLILVGMLVATWLHEQLKVSSCYLSSGLLLDMDVHSASIYMAAVQLATLSAIHR